LHYLIGVWGERSRGVDGSLRERHPRQSFADPRINAMRFSMFRHSTHALEPSAVTVRRAFRAIIQAEYRGCGADGTLAAQQCFLAREQANNFWSLIERDDNAKCKGNGAADAGEMFAPCVH